VNTPDYISQGIEAARERHETALENRYAEICEAEGKKSLQPYVAPEQPTRKEYTGAGIAIVKVTGVLGGVVIFVKMVIVGMTAIFIWIEANSLACGIAVVTAVVAVLFRAASLQEPGNYSKSSNSSNGSSGGGNQYNQWNQYNNFGGNANQQNK
jgi:uncharacterized membrane protein YgcG